MPFPGKHERCTWPKHSTHLIICGVRPLNAILQVTHDIFTIGCRHVLWVKICLLKSNWQRHGVCHSLLSALPWKFFYFWKYFLFGPEHHSNGPENNNTYGPKKKRAGKVWAGKTWAGSSAYLMFINILPVRSFDFQCNYSTLRCKRLKNMLLVGIFKNCLMISQQHLPGYGKTPSEVGQVNGWSDGKCGKH